MDLIGRPFSQKTRDHFLPLLTSTAWWSQTQLALRRVFQLDPDFQERMFARQIAVMKGQAWNVVETLKTPDHGPLELTRRAKVCVWDDLVEVPIAVPMRVTSAERRSHAAQSSDFAKGVEDEMDIGAANSHPEPAEDLLEGATPPADLPHPGRFEITSETAIDDAQSPDEPSSLLLRPNASSPLTSKTTSPERPRLPRTSLGASYSGPQRTLNKYSPRHERRYSYATAASRHNSNTIAQQLYRDRAAADYYDDDVECDLGYAAAEGMEGNQRKVIVERLEPVKSKNPVFSWC